MKRIFTAKQGIVFLGLIILSSCVSHSRKVVCPTFDSPTITKGNKVKMRTTFSSKTEVFSFHKSPKYKSISSSNALEPNPQRVALEGETVLSFANVTQTHFHGMEFNQYEEHEIDEVKFPEIEKPRKVITTSMKNNKRQKEETIKISTVSDIHPTADIQQKTKRRNAVVIGGSLLLMAVLAGISIPVLGTLTASIGLVGIFLLDILVSVGIYKYHKHEKPTLARSSSILRLLYTAILGVGIGYHIAGSVPMFNKIWGLGLITFGIHLITLGIMFNNEGRKKWVNVLIKSLLILAGIGYVIQYVGILLVPNPIGFALVMESIFILPMILGEVSYALWMLFKGGKKSS